VFYTLFYLKHFMIFREDTQPFKKTFHGFWSPYTNLKQNSYTFL